MTLLELHAIELRHGKQIVFADFSHAFGAGSHAIVGKNGVGKSTLLSAMAGALSPTRGRVEIAGMDLYRQPVQAKARLFFVPDSAHFYPFVSGRDFLAFVLRSHGRAMDEASSDWLAWVRDLGIGPYMDTVFGSMSLGTRMKCFLFAAFLLKPSVLIFDEPFNGLDKESRRVVVNAMKELSVSSAVIFSTHQESLADAIHAREWRLSGCPNHRFESQPGGVRLDSIRKLEIE